MSTKQAAKQRIASAERGCKQANDAWAKASEALGGGVATNGFGIFHDHAADLRDKLEAARASIDEAFSALNNIEWPTDADYDSL